MNPRLKKILHRLAVLVIACTLVYSAFWFVKWKIFAVPTVGTIAFSPDGRTLAGGGGWLVPHEGTGIKGAVWLWDAANGSLKYRLIGDDVFQVVAFSEDGTTVAGWQKDGKQFTWDATTGQLLKVGNPWPPVRATDGYYGERMVSERLAEEPDGSLPFVPTASGCRIATAKSLSLFVSRMTRMRGVLEKAANPMTEETFLALSGKENLLATYKWKEKAQSGNILLRGLSTGNLEQTLPKGAGPARLTKFSPDGRLLAFEQHGGPDPGGLYLWNVRRHRLRAM